MPAKHSIKFVDDFETSVRTHEMKGALPPEDWDEIEYDYDEAKANLIGYIKFLRRSIRMLREKQKTMKEYYSGH